MRVFSFVSDDPDYRRQVPRLMRECARFSIPCYVHRVPKLFASRREAFQATLAALAEEVEAFGGEVLYLDLDVMIRRPPDLLMGGLGKDVDFAWFPTPDGQKHYFAFTFVGSGPRAVTTLNHALYLMDHDPGIEDGERALHVAAQANSANVFELP